MHICGMYESRALANLYVNSEDDHKWLSEYQCNFLQLPSISEKGLSLSMTKMEFHDFLATIIPKIKKKGKLCERLDHHVFPLANFEASVWKLYKTQYIKREMFKEDRGNFVRRVVAQELNKREIDTNLGHVAKEVQDVAKEVQEMKVTLCKILHLLEKKEEH